MGFQFTYEYTCINDLGAKVILEISKVRITGYNIIRFSLQGAGKKFVVCRVICDSVSLIIIFGNNCLSEYQPKKALNIFFIRIKSSPYPLP